MSASDAVERARVISHVQAGPFLCTLSLASRKAAVTLNQIFFCEASTSSSSAEIRVSHEFNGSNRGDGFYGSFSL